MYLRQPRTSEAKFGVMEEIPQDPNYVKGKSIYTPVEPGAQSGQYQQQQARQ